MKVLKFGTLSKEYAVVDCKKCKSKLKVYREDIRKTYYDRNHPIQVVNCAVCSKEIHISNTAFKFIEKKDEYNGT